MSRDSLRGHSIFVRRTGSFWKFGNSINEDCHPGSEYQQAKLGAGLVIYDKFLHPIQNLVIHSLIRPGFGVLGGIRLMGHDYCKGWYPFGGLEQDDA